MRSASPDPRRVKLPNSSLNRIPRKADVENGFTNRPHQIESFCQTMNVSRCAIHGGFWTRLQQQ